MIKSVVGLAACAWLAACGYPRPQVGAKDAGGTPDASAADASPDAPPIDSPPPDGPPFGSSCDVLTQTGCAAGDRCGWIVDSTTPPAGHIGCVPTGAIAIGSGCTLASRGSAMYDNCGSGAVCEGGICKLVCDTAGGAPACDVSHYCATYANLLTNGSGSAVAGVCDFTCNPLDDNDFDGSGTTLTKAGSGCSEAQGCVGFWSSTGPSHFQCANDVNPTLFHRSTCTTTNSCESVAGNPYLNGCAQGYEPIVASTTGSNMYACVAFCKPQDCYQGHCGTGGLDAMGAAPHRCNSTDARGTFNTITSTNPDGDQCMYAWSFEQQPDGSVRKDQFSDTTGLCFDHSLYLLNDSTGMNTSTTPIPACSSLPLSASGSSCYGAFNGQPANLSGCTAQQFGCVSTTTGNVPGAPHRRLFSDLRLPYHFPLAPASSPLTPPAAAH